MKAKFYVCNHCGNIIAMINDSGAVPVCCGEPMELLVAGAKDAAVEKHVPDVTVDGKKVFVKVGSVAHPMTEEHYIMWVAVETDKGVYFKNLKPGEKPETMFCLGDDKGVAVYAYCNLHGLWVKEL